MKQFWLTFREIAEVVIISLFTVYIIRTFLMQPFLVSGASMEPNFSNGHYLLIDELSYRFREPKRGEIIVFRYPGDERTFYIKRVIGLPGERIVVKDSEVIVYNREFPNGLPLEEHYLPEDIATSGNVDTTLGADEYFVMGDNRYYSFDSRNWGTLTRDEIIGVARLRLFPFTEISAFEAPTY